MPVGLSRFHTPEPDTLFKGKSIEARRRYGLKSAETTGEGVLVAVCGVTCFLLASISVPV